MSSQGYINEHMQRYGNRRIVDVTVHPPMSAYSRKGSQCERGLDTPWTLYHISEQANKLLTGDGSEGNRSPQEMPLENIVQEIGNGRLMVLSASDIQSKYGFSDDTMKQILGHGHAAQYSDVLPEPDLLDLHRFVVTRKENDGIIKPHFDYVAESDEPLTFDAVPCSAINGADKKLAHLLNGFSPEEFGIARKEYSRLGEPLPLRLGR